MPSIIYIGTQSKRSDREQIKVSDADDASIPQGQRGWRGSVTDLETGEIVKLRQADCGADNCWCAVERDEETSCSQ